jgi:MtfA peptidase
MIAVIVFIIIIISIVVFYSKRKKTITTYELPADASQLLENNVTFYQELGDADKTLFEGRVRDFLAHTTVRGVNVEIEDLDRLLVAAGAIIPIFAFPDWKYNNIAEVLIYKDAFTKEFETTGDGRNVLGMVGDGAMHRQMILSKSSLRQSFGNDKDGQNVAIHEFVHLIDKADGYIDGLPEYLLTHPEVLPWLTVMKDTIRQMKSSGAGGINIYGATNDAEFFAVVSEYFFERPHKLKENHPELYAMLDNMFHP